MTIRAVFFDMGGTIQTFGYTPELRLAATPGLQGTARVRRDRSTPWTTISSLSTGVRRTGSLSSNGASKACRSFLRSRVWRDYILTGYPVDSNVTGLDRRGFDGLHRNLLLPSRNATGDARQFSKPSSDMGLKIGLISNVCSRGQVPNNLDEYGHAPLSSIPLSFRASTAGVNPTRQFFIMPPAWPNVPTSECLYVGDRIARDIVGARKAGFRYADPDQT